MEILNVIFEKAKLNKQKVAFPEATEEKILLTARECKDKGICEPYLVGNIEEIKNASIKYCVSIDDLFLIDAYDEAYLSNLITRYALTNTMFSEKSLKRKSKDPLYTTLMMQALGDVDVTFAGLTHSTGEVILAGQSIVGLQEGVTTVSSVGIFNIPNYNGSEGCLLGFGDSAVCTDPDSEELASIAISACDTIKSLLGWEPRCAMLSYSTCGSGSSILVEKVVDAVKIANEKRPDLLIDGEFQLDTAINPKIAAKKVNRESKVAGKANIIIWPDINVGNIGVKLVQQFAHADAYGPMLQGFAKIVCDCSRGAPVSEMVGNVAMSCVRAQGAK
ncbi:MAG: phosphate acetyltransferase [Bacilli bacterium]|nr:phosphate acetyltransferase [Bacilli bacterium]